MSIDGINTKRMIICLVLGAIAGVLCAGGTAMLNPGISVSYLFHIWYLRLVLGIVIGLIGGIELIESDLINSIIRGAIFGIILSIPYLMIPVPTVTNYPIAGVVFGIFIDLISSKLAPEE